MKEIITKKIIAKNILQIIFGLFYVVFSMQEIIIFF